MNADRRKKLNALQDLLQQTGLSAAMGNLKLSADRGDIRSDRHDLDLVLVHVSREALARMCDPANYLGQSGVMVDRVLARQR